MLIKRIALLVVISMLGLTTTILAADDSIGIVKGRVVNGSEGGSGVAAQEITIKTFENGSQINSTTAKTDTDGRFVFNSLSTRPDYSYQVVLTFQEAEYFSELFSFVEGETSKSIELTVYYSTSSDEAIRVTTARTVIYVETDSLRVTEYYLVNNEDDQTYIGLSRAADGIRETLWFPLPDEATELQLASGLMECCFFGSEGGFVDSMPVLPGVKEVSYSYIIIPSSNTYDFSRRINYPTANYDLLVQGEGIDVTSDQLAKEESLDMAGILFSYLSGTALTPGDTLVIRLSGLSGADNQEVILWVVVTLVVITLGAGSVYLLRKRGLQPVSPEDSLNQKKQELLVELAQLDDDFEDGKIQREAYLRLRAEKKSELVALIHKSREVW